VLVPDDDVPYIRTDQRDWTGSLRITFVLPFASLAGGIRVAAAYARHLTEAGHEVWVVSTPQRVRGHPVKARLIESCLRLTGRLERKETPLFDFLGKRHVVLERSRDVMARDLPDADAVIATWWQTAPAVAALPPEKGTKFYLLQDYETFSNQPVNAVADTYRLPLRKIAVSSYIKTCLVENHGIPEQAITVIPNAVDTCQFDAPVRSRTLPPSVGFLYHRHPRKRVALAIEAVKLAHARRPDLRVVVFGRREHDPDMELPGWVEYHSSPPQETIPRIYASADMWLFPSRSEGFGLPILEAMACRTPVLAAPAGAAPDLIDGRNGRILDETPEAFAEAILDMIDLPEAEWQAMSDAAHRTAQGHGWPEAARRLAEELGAAVAMPAQVS